MKTSEHFRSRVLYALMFLSPLPFLLSIDRPRAFGVSGVAWISTAQYAASIFGYVGITLLVWQLILGTRSISGLFFENLPNKLKLHRTLGKYGVLLIFLHPLLIFVNYGQGLLYLFQPSLTTSEFEKHVTFGRLALYGLLLLWVSSALLRSKIGFRPWKYLHYIAYPVLLSALLHVPEVGHSYGDTVVRTYWTILVIVVVMCWALRARHLFGIGKYQYRITAKEQVNKLVWMLTITPHNKRLQAHNGQYMYVQRSLLSEEHPFSIVNIDKASGAITIAFKEFGKYTRKLARMNEGDHVLVDGPYGVFTREIVTHPKDTAVFIAGGIGITPFVQHILSRKPSLTTVFYAAKTADEAAFLPKFQKYLGKSLITVFSEVPEGSTAHGRFITKVLLKKQLSKEHMHNAHFYICGPPKFMEAVAGYLLQLGIPKERLHIEDFSF